MANGVTGKAPELMEIFRSRGRLGPPDLAPRKTALDLMRCILPALTRLWISITTVRSSGYRRLCQQCTEPVKTVP